MYQSILIIIRNNLTDEAFECWGGYFEKTQKLNELYVGWNSISHKGS